MPYTVVNAGTFTPNKRLAITIPYDIIIPVQLHRCRVGGHYPHERGW